MTVKKITGALFLVWLGLYSIVLPLGLMLNRQPDKHRSLIKTTQTINSHQNRANPHLAKERATVDTPVKITSTLPGAPAQNVTQTNRTPSVIQTGKWLKTGPKAPTANPATTTPTLHGTAISAYQYQMLARIISAEAKGEPFHGQVAVGAVILNRVASERFPDTIAANVLKRGQFEPVANGTVWNEPTASAYRAARLALQGWDPSGGALYFFNPAKTRSRWIWSRPIVNRIGDHVFAV